MVLSGKAPLFQKKYNTIFALLDTQVNYVQEVPIKSLLINTFLLLD
jgi:hypothetical protein